MLTAIDFKKLEKVLDNKLDNKFDGFKKDLEQNIPTKKDLKIELAKLDKKFATKKEFYSTSTDLFNLIIDFRKEWKADLKDLKEEIRGFSKEIASILKNHESRLTTLEDNTFS